MGRAAITRVEAVSWNAADRWVCRAAVYAGRFNECNTRGFELTELQADELKTFAQSKRHSTGVFTTLEVCSRLWTSTVVGRRSYRNTHTLLNDTLVRGKWVGPPLIMTNGFQYYARVIRELFGVACTYAQVIKTWRKNCVTKVERHPVIGTSRRLQAALERSKDSSRANTTYIERLNLTIRQSVAYLFRRSPSHAHREARLCEHLELAPCYYNFVRPNTALRFGVDVRTPAMVAMVCVIGS